jgi:hypothetical protein
MTIPTNETHSFDDWWCLLVNIASQQGVRRVGPSTDAVWLGYYDAGLTPGAAFVKEQKRLKGAKK